MLAIVMDHRDVHVVVHTVKRLEVPQWVNRILRVMGSHVSTGCIGLHRRLLAPSSSDAQPSTPHTASDSSLSKRIAGHTYFSTR